MMLTFVFQYHFNPSQSILVMEGDDIGNINRALQKVSYINSRQFPTAGVRRLKVSSKVQWVDTDQPGANWGSRVGPLGMFPCKTGFAFLQLSSTSAVPMRMPQWICVLVFFLSKMFCCFTTLNPPFSILPCFLSNALLLSINSQRAGNLKWSGYGFEVFWLKGTVPGT